MDKKSKEALRRYKKSRQQSSSESSSSSDSDSGSSSSYSSSSSGRKAAERHRKKKARQAAAAARRSSSSSGDERRKREKREHACQKKLEAKRNHLKRKLKEAKLKKRAAAAAAAAMGGHSHRSLSPGTQAKLKKLAEKKHLRAASKERREREREKHRALVAREREHHSSQQQPHHHHHHQHHHGHAQQLQLHRADSRSPTKITKIRIHQDVKRQRSPKHVHQQLMSREKIIIQTRTRERTPSAERQRHSEHSKQLRHGDDVLRDRERRDRERAEREAARDKERAEALARCQERQRERERIAREKLRRQQEEEEAVEAAQKYGGGGGGGSVGGGAPLLGDARERLLPRAADRELAIAAARGYNSREHSLEALEPASTSSAAVAAARHAAKRERELELYERERDFLDAERRGLLDREQLRREREYLTARRRELSALPSEHYAAARMRDERVRYAEEDERERAYAAHAYLDDGRALRSEREAWLDPRELREREMRGLRDRRELEHHELLYPEEREREHHLVRDRERTLSARADWKEEWPAAERDWEEPSGPRSGGGFIGGPVRGGGGGGGAPVVATKLAPPPREQRAPSEPDWDADEAAPSSVPSVGAGGGGSRDGNSRGAWDEARDTPTREKRLEHGERRWQPEWRDNVTGPEPLGSSAAPPVAHLQRESRGPRPYRGRGGGGAGSEHSERSAVAGGGSYRGHHGGPPQPLMTLPVSTPGGYHGANPRFPNKRNMTYTNPNLIKKQQAALAAAKAAAQASAVVAATTAVAAAKAAAQSAANATTNPGILGQVGGVNSRAAADAEAEKPEAGEIVGDTDGAESGADKLMKPLAAGDGELSEISDSDDDILDKETKESVVPTMAATTAAAAVEEKVDFTAAGAAATFIKTDDVKTDDADDLLDFEEISDGELEEDARNKGVGDALGVDWASLIASTKQQAAQAAPSDSEQSTSAKQRWQPHRILLDIGVSLRMAGEDYGRQLLRDALQKRAEELSGCGVTVNDEQKLQVKREIKDEICDEDSQTMEAATTAAEEATATFDKKSQFDEGALGAEQMHAMACVQVGERLRRQQRRTLIASACGINSRALSAQHDLRLRRQLCGLPARGYDLPRPMVGASNKLKAMALAAFQRTLQVQ